MPLAKRAGVPTVGLRFTVILTCSLASVARPLLQERLVHLHAEPWAVERQDRAVGVLHGPAHHVARRLGSASTPSGPSRAASRSASTASSARPARIAGSGARLSACATGDR